MAETKISFTGDVAFSRYYRDKYDDPNLISQELVEFLNDSHYGVFNIEGPMCEPTQAGTFIHSNNPAALGVIQRLKGNIWNLCNNHMMDAGADGCRETIELARSCGYQTLGAGKDLEEAMKPVILPEAGGIGMISVGFQPLCVPATWDSAGCFSWERTDLIRRAIREIKKNNRWCIVVVHGGREFCDIPMTDIRERYESYLTAGADIVVGHHPHVPQNYQWVGDKIIFYSLGNFIFDTDYQRAQFHTDTGVLLKLFFTEEKFRFEAVGTQIDRETEHVAQAPLPAVFRDLQPADYDAVCPLAAERFISHVKRRVSFLKPEEYPSPDMTPQESEAVLEQELKRYPCFRHVLREVERLGNQPLDEKYAALQEYLV